MPDSVAELDKIIGNLFRAESGKMVSVLTRMLGFSNYDVAEDIVQDTLLKAAHVWKFKGVPENPSAWLYTVVKRKAIDFVRQQKIRLSVHDDIVRGLTSEWTLSPTVNQLFLPSEIEDSQLRMIFACCHPDIPYESQLALTLKTLCGLSVSEIAKAFLTNEETITKRIYRAREKIHEEAIALEVPVGPALLPRLEAVWLTLYLLFNEGYHSSDRDDVIREDLCLEAMRLCLLLTKNNTCNLPQSEALLALMCLQASRQGARLNDDGELVLLKDQDRSRWSYELISQGLQFLEASWRNDVVSAYHIEAAIAAIHARAKSFEQTDWKQILELYTALEDVKPGPVTALNKAIAVGYARSFSDGLSALKAIEGLESNVLYYTALGDFYIAVNEQENARQSYQRGFALACTKSEQQLISNKLSRLI